MAEWDDYDDMMEAIGRRTAAELARLEGERREGQLAAAAGGGGGMEHLTRGVQVSWGRPGPQSEIFARAERTCLEGQAGLNC